MTDTILTVLQWLIPSGSLGAVIIWLTNKSVRDAEMAQKAQDAYKTMYDNLSATLIDLQNENTKLYKAVRELNRTLQRATTCKHYADCPVRFGLQDFTEVLRSEVATVRPKRGQHKARHPEHNDSGSSEVGNNAEDSDGEPP